MELIDWLAYLVAFVIAAIIVGNILTYFLQEYIVMWPVKLELGHAFTFKHRFKEFNISTADKGIINGLLFTTDQSKGLVFYCHGNARNIEYWANRHRLFTSFGYDALFFDYRGYGKSRGKKNEKIFYSDAKAIYDEFSSEYKDKPKIIYGRSMGCAIASELASQVNPDFLVLESPFYSMPKLFYIFYPWLPRLFFFRYKFPNNKHLEKVECPVIIFHGKKDFLVPFKNSLLLKKHLKPSDKLFEFDHGTHSNITNFEAYYLTLKQILK